MADLAKTKTRIGTQDQSTYRRDGIQGRTITDLPGLEVNAGIRRPNGDAANELRRVLGMVTDAASAIGDAAGRRQDEVNREAAGAGQLDALSGSKDEDRYAKSRSYQRAFDYEGARQGAYGLDTSLSQAIDERLADEDNPATLADIGDMIDRSFAGYALDGEGKPRSFGSPEAAGAVADQLSKTRARLMGAAATAITEQVNTKTLSTIAGNILFERAQTVAASPSGIVTSVGEGQPGSVAAGAAAAPAAPAYKLSKLGFVSGQDLKGIFGSMPGVRITSTTRTPEHNRAVGGVPNSQHVSGSAIDMVGVTPAQAKEELARRGLAGEIIHHDAGSGMHVHIESVRPVSGAAPEVATGPQPTPVAPKENPLRAEPVDFEAYMARVPETIQRGPAKKQLLAALMTGAVEAKDDRFLDGLWQSKRKDGSPSFAPDEIKSILDARDTVRDRVRIEADRVRRQRYEDNSEQLMSAMAQGDPVSIETIRSWESRDLIPGAFANSLINSIESERRQEARMSTAEARDAARSADVEYDADVAGEAELVRMGVTHGYDYDSLRRRFDAGDFGVGKGAVRRMRSLMAARRAGEQEALKDPEVAVWASKIDAGFKPAKSGGGNSRVAAALGGGAGSAAQVDMRPAMIAEYQKLIKNGEKPAAAYVGAVAKYGSSDPVAQKRAKLSRIKILEGR